MCECVKSEALTRPVGFYNASSSHSLHLVARVIQQGGDHYADQGAATETDRGRQRETERERERENTFITHTETVESMIVQ